MNTSASGLKRFMACSASSILPQVKSSSEHAEVGRKIHSFMELAATVGKEKALETVESDLHARCAGIDVTGILSDFQATYVDGVYARNFDIEPAYALDPVKRTARKLGNSLGRSYPPLEDGEIPGAEDIIGHLNSGRICTLDYKSGEYIPDIQHNPQLLFFAAVIYLIHKVDEVEGRIVYIADDGSHTIDTCIYTVFDIENYLSELAAACTKYWTVLEQYKAGAQLSVAQGSWCKYCSSLPHCPAYTSLAKRLVPELEEIESKIASMTPQQAGLAWVKYKQIKDIFTRVEESLKGYARSVELVLPDDRGFVGESTFKRRYLSTDKAVRLLNTLGASQKDLDSLYSVKEISTIRERKNKE